MSRHRTRLFLLAGAAALVVAAPGSAKRRPEAPLPIAKIYFEYNSSANDLGVHVIADGEDWRRFQLENPAGRKLIRLDARGPYRELGLTELFFEGAEPSLDDVPLDELLALFPEGEYEFEALGVDGVEQVGVGILRHAIPAGPEVTADVGPGDSIAIRWELVDAPPPGFPSRPIDVVAYQVIVEPFQVNLPGTATQVTLPPEFAASLAPGEHPFEVLAIEASGNQTITEGSFTTQ
ncbi:MAG TPA: hypothetical protein VHQ66_15925 [Myxococcota bacterium]|jgi:hypothetical protein|nr:hypothetical protein [Myxococcota bacterium]